MNNKHTYESLYATIKEQYSRKVKEDTDEDENQKDKERNKKKEERNRYLEKVINTYNNPSAANIEEVLRETTGIKREEKEIDNTYVYMSGYGYK